MKAFNISLIFGLTIAVLLSMARFDALCDDIRSNVFRLHIIPASDSEDDQLLKLKVRDEILNLSANYFEKCDSKEMAIDFAKNNCDFFAQVAKQTIEENGYDYDVNVTVEECYFENREYDKFTLPAGNYQALKVVIGNGNGKNWWCIMFPAVCIGASRKLDNAVTQESADVAENPKKFQMGFKMTEIYQYFKKILGN